jgi:Ca-activated chloride channel family protein
LLIVALARPRVPATAVRKGGVDLVVLQDGSASMRVRDVAGDRWQRSVRFLRTLGDAMDWNQDRLALALFAHIAAPQIRLTKDPNTFFFFLDHLDQTPPFLIDDVTTWDTNLELGIHWGIRLIERDEEIQGKNANAKMFVMLSDGESWSGEVANSLKEASAHNIPLHAIGVGTLAGGAMPVFRDERGEVVNDPDVPKTSRLDREGLQRIALAGGGQYFELDRDGDRRIATTLIDAGRRAAPSRGTVEETEDFYWRFIAAAALLPFVGLLFLRDRSELWLHLAGTVAATLAVFSILG